MRSSSTLSDYSDIPTTVKVETENQKYEYSNTIYTSRDSTVRSVDNESNRNLPEEVVTDSDVQTTPPTTTPVTLREATPQGPPMPETLPPPTTTRLTPTVTRIVTSVTESGTTERQIIAVNRVPYIAIAALRGQTVYPGSVVHNRHQIVSNDDRTLNRTTATTVPVQAESTTRSLVEKSTSTSHSEPKLEKIMEVNRVTLVTLKEEMSTGSTRTTFGNETTDRMLAEGKPEKEMNKVSQTSQLKHRTVVGGSLAVTPAADYTTDKLQEITPLVSLDKTTHLENTIDVKDEILPVKSHNLPTTSSYSPDNFSADTLSVTEHSLSPLTSKQTDSIISTVDEATSVSPLNNRRRQGSGRKPGIDGFKRSRTRPVFSTTSAEPIVSSTSSPIYQKRRGQRKGPRPYRPTSTTEADEEVGVLPDPDKTNARHEAVNVNENNEPRRTFIPKRGQRKRPRPDLPTSTSVSVDEVVNLLNKSGGENVVLVTESIANTTVGFIPKRGSRRRGTTRKPTTETSNPTTRTTQRDEIGTLSTGAKEVNDVNESFSVASTEPYLPDSPDSIKSSTQGVETFSSEHESAFVPIENRRYRTSSTESSLKSELSDHTEVSTIRYSQRTASYPLHNTSPDSELHTPFTSDSNSTENTTNEGEQQTKDVTYRPSSTSAYTESVTQVSTKSSTPASSENGTGRSDKVRVKKRRRRPLPARNVNTPEESTSDMRASSGSKVDNDIKSTDLTASRNVSGNTAEENSVTPFATAALLGREDYEIGTPSSVGEFLTTVDREGKHVVKISVLNDPNDTAASLKTQRGKSVSNRHKGDDKDVRGHNPSNNYETSSYNSELTTDENSDLNTDGSGYATGDEGRNSIYPLSDYLKPLSEDRDSFPNSSLDVPTEGHSEGISRANSSKASTSQHAKNYVIASVDFTADPAGNQTLGSTAATDRHKKGSANPEDKTRRLVRRKRPSSTTEGPQVQSEVG
jgi:hypothetical protein